MPSSLQGESTAGGHVSTRPAGFVNPSVGRHQLNTRKAAPLHSLGWGGWLAGWLADRTCHEAEARTTFEAIKTTVAAEKVTPQHGWFEMLVTPTPVVRWALIIGLGTAVLQQVRTPLQPPPLAAEVGTFARLSPLMLLGLRWRAIVTLLGKHGPFARAKGQ